MFVVQNFIFALAWLVDTLLSIYRWLIIGAVIISWVNADPYNPIVRFVRNVTEPVLSLARRAMPFLYMSGIDLSPIVVLLALEVLRIFLAGSLYELAGRMLAQRTGYGFH
jgi:YggT family protein